MKRSMTGLSPKDAIYITSWAAYNDGNSLRDGGWFLLDELADLSKEEIFDKLRFSGLEPDGYDEELVIHDYDDYTGIGYYDLFGEAYPMTVIDFYRQLKELDDDEVKVFLGLAFSRGTSDALEALEEGNLGNYNIISEDTLDDILREDVDNMIISGRIDILRRYLDEDDLISDLEDDITIDDETGEPEYEIDDYMVEDIIESSSADYLARYFDFDYYKRDVLMDGYYEEFELEGDTYYLYEW